MVVHLQRYHQDHYEQANYRSYPAVLVFTTLAFFISWSPQFLLQLAFPTSNILIKVVTMKMVMMRMVTTTTTRIFNQFTQFNWSQVYFLGRLVAVNLEREYVWCNISTIYSRFQQYKYNNKKDYKGNVEEFQCLFIIHWSQRKSGLLQVVIIHLLNRLISNRS